MVTFISCFSSSLVFASCLCYLRLEYLFIATVFSCILWYFHCKHSNRAWKYHCDGWVAPGFEKVEQVFRGLMDYKEPICKYWPEFAQKGKEKLTVETLLSHRAGLIAVREKMQMSWINDEPERLADMLARQEPFWTPGTAQGYQTVPYGPYADILLRRVDHQGRSLSRFFHEEIAKPFEIDFFIGQPKDQQYRACRESRADFGWIHFLTVTLPKSLVLFGVFFLSIYRYGTVYLFKMLRYTPTDYSPKRINDPDYRAIGGGSSHGFGTATGLAKLMGILANGGQHKGRTLLSPKAIELLNTPLSNEVDRVVLNKITFGPGSTIKNGEAPSTSQKQMFGYWGAGGNGAYCDPQHKVGWAYITNYFNVLHGLIIDHRYVALETAMYDCIDQLHKDR